MQQRPDKAEEPFDLWWPAPPQYFDPAQRVHQVHALIERRRFAVRQRDQTFDQMVRGMAQRSVTTAPSSFTEGVRRSLLCATIAPVPAPEAPIARRQPLVAIMAHTLRTLPERYPLSERQRRAALGGASTMALVFVVGGLSVAVAPSEMLALVGAFSALLFTTAAVGHLLSAAMNAILGTTALAVGACILYAALAFAWVRLVRQPVEV